MIRFTRLRVVNFYQHKDREFDMTGSLIGVVGRNGRGKSHMLDALHFSLAGDLPGSDKSKMLRWGAKEGRVEVDLTCDGHSYTIARALEKPKATLVKDGETIAKSVSAVNESVKAELGVDKDLCKQAMFVRQAEIDAVLFEDPSVRELAWQRLCGIGMAAKTYDKLTKFVGSLPPLEDHDKRIKDCLELLGSARTQYREAWRMVREFRALPFNSMDPAKLRARVGELNALLAEFQQGTRLRDEWKQRMMELQAAERRLYETSGGPPEMSTLSSADLRAQAAGFEQEAGRIEQLIREAVRINDRKVEIANQIARHEAAAKALNEAKAMLPGMDNNRAALEQINVEMQALWDEATKSSTKASELVAALRQLTGKATCPMCSAEVSQTTLERWRGEMTTLEQMAAVCRSEHMTRTRTRDELVRARDNAERAFTMASAAELATREAAELASREMLTLLDPGMDTAAMGAARGQAEAHRINARMASEQAARLKSFEDQANLHKAAIAKATGAIASLHDAINASDGRIGMMGASVLATEASTKSELSDESKRLQDVESARLALAKASGTLASTIASVKTLVRRGKDLKKAKRGQKLEIDARGTVETVRQWFHYSRGPHAVVLTVLDALAKDVNSFLGVFEAPFHVTPDKEKLLFRVSFTDGREQPEEPPPSDILSGGERIMLALSFRFSAYAMFAAKLGVLSLDEPTVYLDNYNVANFCKLLEKVKTLAGRMGLQVLISTHEREVMPLLDAVVDLG